MTMKRKPNKNNGLQDVEDRTPAAHISYPASSAAVVSGVHLSARASFSARQEIARNTPLM